jgi:uncharacterized membrane protein
MEWLKWLARFGIVFAAFLAVDMVWLVFVARKFYVKQIGFLMREPVNFVAAFVFYIIFVAGILFFVLQPALEKDSLAQAALAGAFFGLVTYATYDLTNLSTVKDWPLLVTVVDLAWGTTLSLLVSVIGFLAIRRWVP